MKNLILFFVAIGISSISIGQADSLPIYKRFPDVPPLKLRTVPDSLLFVKTDLPKKKPLLIMIFSPDCDHCQVATKDLLKQIKLFKKVQIIMVSSLDFANILAFYKSYKIADYPNIIMARDPAYFLGTFYSIKNFPSLFLYDKKGKLVREFEGSVSFSEIAGWLK
ncbi:MAG: thioredoxin fold domain-containing protein [Ferruginibacter sp.]